MFTPIFSRVVNRVHDDVCSELNFALLKAPLQYSVNEQNLTPDTKYVMKIALLLAIYVVNFIFHGNTFVTPPPPRILRWQETKIKYYIILIFLSQ